MRAVGIILAGGNNNRMKELTHKRAVEQCQLQEAIDPLILHLVI